jgi:hypothetical protein
MKKLLVLMVLFLFCVLGPNSGLAQTADDGDAAHHPTTTVESPTDESGAPDTEGEAVDQADESAPLSMMPMMMGREMMGMMRHHMAGKKAVMMSRMMAGMMGLGPKAAGTREKKKHGMMMDHQGMMKMKHGQMGKRAFFDLDGLDLTPEQYGKIRETSYEQLKKLQQLKAERELLEIEASYLTSAEQVDEKRAKEVFARLGEIRLETFLTGRQYLETFSGLLNEEQKKKLESAHH